MLRKTPLRRSGFKKVHKPKPTLSELKERGLVTTADASPRTKALKLADDNFAKWKKLLISDDGYLNCFICGKNIHWKESELMHFQPRTCMSTRYDETANHPGCHSCNSKPLGDRANFAIRLDEEYGDGYAEMLTNKSKRMEKFTTEHLLFIADVYAKRLAWLQKSH